MPKRDWSKPYTPAEIQNLKDVFRGLPTYRTGGWIKASDIPELINKMGFPRTPEQVQAYQEYWEKSCGGLITMEHFLSSASSLHSNAEFARDYALKFDKYGTGFIPKEAFQALMDLMVTHEPKLAGKTYEEFLAEADFDKDGKVSVDECTNWIKSNCSF